MGNLNQSNLKIVAGERYRLYFDAVAIRGNLKIYQGTQLIFDISIVRVGNLGDINELINVTENIKVNMQSLIVYYDGISISELITLNNLSNVSTVDSISISEDISITII